jgi:hypothetical protein
VKKPEPSAGEETRQREEDRALLLARRARFVAAALAAAGLTAASCDKNPPDANPRPCLSVAPVRDAGPPPPPPEPMVCLSPIPPPPPDAAPAPQEKKEPS